MKKLGTINDIAIPELIINFYNIFILIFNFNYI